MLPIASVRFRVVFAGVLAFLSANGVSARALPDAPAMTVPAAIAVPGGVAQAPLTLERVFASPSLNGTAPRGLRLSPDGRWLTLLRNRDDERQRYDLWGLDRQNGQWRMLVDSRRLSVGATLSEDEKMQRERLRIGDLAGIVSYEWSPDGQHLLVPLEGRLWLAGLDGSVHEITGAGGGALNPLLSRTGRWLSFVRDRRLWVAPVDGKSAPVAITPEESADTVHWGEAEFVAQEEMHRFAGAWWAPGDGALAVERFDEAGVGLVTRAAIGASGTTTYAQRYPVAGSPNARVELWVMRPDGSQRVKLDLGPDPDIYLARVDWSHDGTTLYVQRENRAQTRLDMLAIDAKTGAARVLFTEMAPPTASGRGSWVTLSDNYRFLRDGSLIWWSERDGYGHLWHFRALAGGGGEWRQLTRGHWVVTALNGVDEAAPVDAHPVGVVAGRFAGGGTDEERAGAHPHDTATRIFFTATKDDVLAPQVYALDLAQDAQTPEHITRLTEPGWVNAATMDGAGRTLIITRSSPVQPPQTYLADASGKRLMWVEENALDARHPYAPFVAAHRAPSFGTITAEDGSTLHWKMILPDLAPGKRYAVFFEHYGGPSVQLVNRAWTGALAQWIAAQGYVYFEIDGRGSNNRGVDFERQIHNAMGTVEVADQLAGVTYLKTLPFVDPAKIATFGWSYGGYMTLKLLEEAPGTFAAGIAGAPVTRWELYDTHYTERYLGMPDAPGGVYAKSGALDRADHIADPLLLIHGMADDNVVFENASELIARLQGNAQPFEMMLYPGYTHSVAGPKISVHMWTTIFDFLKRHGVTPP